MICLLEISPIAEAEIALLEKCFPEGSSAKHLERLSCQQDFMMIGLSVGAETNDLARRLYERFGYYDADFREYTETGEYLDEQGRPHIWKEVCIYLIKGLQDHRLTEAKAA